MEQYLSTRAVPSLVVFSGGLDSTVLLTLLKTIRPNTTIGAVNFYYGSKHNNRERISAQAITEALNVPLTSIDLDFIKDLFISSLLDPSTEIPEGHYAAENMKSTVVPFRNGIMLSIAAGFADSHGFEEIYIGSHAGDHYVYPDCRPAFNRSMKDAVFYGTEHQTQIIAPFQYFTKSKIVEIGASIGAPFSLTWSCYKGGDVHCGKCGTCVERIEAFALNKLIDPVKYE